jgi:hypothetical protein
VNNLGQPLPAFHVPKGKRAHSFNLACRRALPHEPYFFFLSETLLPRVSFVACDRSAFYKTPDRAAHLGRRFENLAHRRVGHGRRYGFFVAPEPLLNRGTFVETRVLGHHGIQWQFLSDWTEPFVCHLLERKAERLFSSVTRAVAAGRLTAARLPTAGASATSAAKPAPVAWRVARGISVRRRRAAPRQLAPNRRAARRQQRGASGGRASGRPARSGVGGRGDVYGEGVPGASWCLADAEYALRERAS